MIVDRGGSRQSLEGKLKGGMIVDRCGSRQSLEGKCEREHHRVETRCAPSVISGVIPSGPECVGRLCEGRGGDTEWDIE